MRASAVLPAGHWDAAQERGVVTLDFDARHRRRWRLTTQDGAGVLLDLPQATHLRDGDGLKLDEGGVIRVVAQPEAVLEIRAGSAGLPRLAYHLGNRHLPIQIFDDRLVIRDDHVIADMAAGLGGVVRRCELPFDPEPGAYGGHASHGGHHHHDHAQDHHSHDHHAHDDHAHDHHAHDQSHAHSHD